jgi:hypothetical protein
VTKRAPSRCAAEMRLILAAGRVINWTVSLCETPSSTTNSLPHQRLPVEACVRPVHPCKDDTPVLSWSLYILPAALIKTHHHYKHARGYLDWVLKDNNHTQQSYGTNSSNKKCYRTYLPICMACRSSPCYLFIHSFDRTEPKHSADALIGVIMTGN